MHRASELIAVPETGCSPVDDFRGVKLRVYPPASCFIRVYTVRPASREHGQGYSFSVLDRRIFR